MHQQVDVRTDFLVEIALDGAVTRHVAEERRKEAHAGCYEVALIAQPIAATIRCQLVSSASISRRPTAVSGSTSLVDDSLTRPTARPAILSLPSDAERKQGSRV